MDNEIVVHIYNGILLSHNKKRNQVICGRPRVCYTEWSQKDKNTYMWLYKNSTDKPICRNRDADIESGCLDIGLMARGMNWKIKTDIKHCRLSASSVHGILQARIMEWVAFLFSRGSCPRDQTWVSHIAGKFFTIWGTSETHKYMYVPVC